MATRTSKENPAILAEDQAEFARLVDQGKVQKDLMEAATTAYQDTRQKILAIAKQHWLDVNEGLDGDAVTNIFDARGRRYNAQVDFTNKYVLNDARLTELQAKFEDVDDFFRKVEVVKIAMDQLDPAQHQAFYREVLALCNEWKVKAMVGDNFEVHDDFHVNRHSELDVDDNVAVDAIVPVHVQLTYGG